MENASQALIIAFSVLVFVGALSMTIVMFGNANEALSSIISYKDKTTEYTYVEPKEKRIVGIETIIPTMYRAYKENYRVVFKNKDGTDYVLYTISTTDGEGKTTTTGVNYIDLNEEIYGTPDESTNHLKSILEGGLYEKLENLEFTEEIGEYYMEDKTEKEAKEKAEAEGKEYEPTETAEVNKTKKRIITYTVYK